MQLKTKYLMPVLTAVLMFGLSNSAFAQLSCSVASTPVSRDTLTGLTEVAGDLIFNCAGGSTATSQATITVSYGGAPITDSTGYPVSKPITILGGTNIVGFTGGAPFIAGVNNASGQITITVPIQNPPAATNSFTLDGVLLSLAGSAAGTGLNANVSVSPGNGVLITAGQNVATVVTSIQQGLVDPTITKNTVAGVVLSSGIAVNAGFSIDIKENYPDMFRTTNQFDTGGTVPPGSGATQATQVTLNFAGIPTGASFTGCTVTDIDPNGTAAAVSILGGANTLTSTANTAVIDFANPALPAGVDLVNVDTLRFACTGFSAGTATLPLSAAVVTVQATLSPSGTALTASQGVQQVTGSDQIPRYTTNLQPATPLQVFSIVAAQTDLLVPYAVVNSASGNYDTGIALANTTADPFGAKTGAAVATSGTVTLSFYPQTGTACTLTTAVGSTTPAAFSMSPMSGLGVGLDASGNLNSGRTWVVLLSQLLQAAPAAAGCPPANAFTGYIFIVANSTEVHGSAFVSNFNNFTSASNVLVLPPPGLTPQVVTSNSRATLQVEILGN